MNLRFAFLACCVALTSADISASTAIPVRRTFDTMGCSPSRKVLEAEQPIRVSASSTPLVLRGGEEGTEGGPIQLKAQLILECNNLLGEAPLWHEGKGKLYWLDINGKMLWEYTPSVCSGGSCTMPSHHSWPLPKVAGSFAFSQDGKRFLMGFASGLAWWDPEKPNESVKICDYEPGLNTRPNDGKCDRQGNFIIGSYNNNHREDKLNIAGLWRLNAKDSSLTEILDYRFRCSNTIAFSPNGDEMYFCDTPTKAIYKFKYSPTGPLTDRTLFYQMGEEEAGGPDGATVDSTGGLWEAQAGNWKVVRHRPADGRVDFEVALPFNNPTSCAIGGDTLYITTARHRLTEEQRKAQPGAGQLWAVELPASIRGLREPAFAG